MGAGNEIYIMPQSPLAEGLQIVYSIYYSTISFLRSLEDKRYCASCDCCSCYATVINIVLGVKYAQSMYLLCTDCTCLTPKK